MQRILKAEARPEASRENLEAVSKTVAAVISDIRTRGDEAVRQYSQQFDNWAPEAFALSSQQIADVVKTVPQQTLADIEAAQANIRAFAEHQLASLSDFEVETMPGVFLGQKSIPVRRAGAYIPGGRYPLLASAHMTIVTAKVAGVDHVIACTPPNQGEIPAATVAAMHMAGADQILLLGGVQAITAMALGTETIGKVDLISGPGNAYVAEAKRQLYGEVGIDLFAGPTEILIVADDQADPFFVAVDLLSQAEHGPDSPAVLITTSEPLGRQVIDQVDALLPTMPTRDFAQTSWETYGQVIVVDSLDEAYQLADEFASEHVEILTERPREALEAMRCYGALFLGAGTCVSYGDKVIGTNHTLPTRGAANYTGGLWVGNYLKTVTYQEITNPNSSAEVGRFCGRAARAEFAEGHARSGDIRAARFGGDPLPWAPEV
ncbi:MAG: histidinol dehydrogenase [Micrococcales bacterium]|nr:histidinol dehydrogenase [Micrococcales bacterium]